MTVDFAKLKNILVLRSDSGVGDEVIYSIIYNNLKKINPGLNIDVLAFYSSGIF